jgi:hypothetical protein
MLARWHTHIMQTRRRAERPTLTAVCLRSCSPPIPGDLRMPSVNAELRLQSPMSELEFLARVSANFDWKRMMALGRHEYGC